MCGVTPVCPVLFYTTIVRMRRTGCAAACTRQAGWVQWETRAGRRSEGDLVYKRALQLAAGSVADMPDQTESVI